MAGLERGLVDDQARGDLHDLLDLDEVVGAQRAAGGHQVDDRVGQPHQRRELHRAVQLDRVDVHALGGEVLARDGHVLGGHAQPRAPAHRGGVVEPAPDRHAHPAAADAQIDRLIEALAAVLEQHVATGHAEVRRAVLDVGGHVGGPDDDQPQARIGGRQDQLAGVEHRGIDLDADRLQQRQRVVEDAPLGQRERDHASSTVRTRSMLAPTAASLRSMRW
jgi:hypothetical protein